MRQFLSFPILFVALVSFGCGDYEIADQPLSGTIDGKPFEIGSGVATYSEKKNTIRVSMSTGTRTSDDCDSRVMGGNGTSIIFSRDAKVDGSELSLSSNITFVISGEETDDGIPITKNIVATEGHWEFTEITDDRVYGGLIAETDDHNVDGTFELIKCPDPFDNF